MSNTPVQVVDMLTANAVRKVKYPILKVLLLGIMGGLMISFGADANMIVGHAIDNAGVARMMGGAIFPVGLISIVLTGSELLTGSCMNVLGLTTKEISFFDLARNFCLVMLANFIGAALLAVTCYAMGQLDMSGGRFGAYAIKLALGKVNMGFGACILSGVWCNVLVCLGIFLGAAAKEVAGKVLGIFFPIWVFVACGFEHCVANMFYLPLGLVCKLNPDYVSVANELYGITADQLNALTAANCFVDNFIPVVIGNIIGGSIFMAGFYYVSLKKVS